MAQLLKRRHELTALRVSVRPRGRDIDAHLELETHEGGTPRTVGEWWLDAAQLGLPAKITNDWVPQGSLPEAFVAALGKAIDVLDLENGHPLWLHLVKPYGLLGAIAWEDALVPHLRRPLLRLPDFLEASRENRSVLDIALVCSEPVSEPRLDPPRLLHALSDAVLAGSPRERTSVHVFADGLHFDALQAAFADQPLVTVHDPAAARHHGIAERGPSTSGDGDRLRNPWLLWIREAMNGSSLDAVHFVCHGHLAGERPALAVAESPLSNRDRSDARYIGVGELAAFLTQTGAWSAVFSDPPMNFSPAGLRLVADSLAQARPGPVIHHRLQPGQDATLQSLYGFLYATEPMPVPFQDGWFAYCQPAIVETQAPVVSAVPRSSAIDRNASLLGAAASSTKPLDDVPNWVSAAQRYVEQVTLDLQRDRNRSPNGALSARNAGADETLEKLQGIVASVAAGVMVPGG